MRTIGVPSDLESLANDVYPKVFGTLVLTCGDRDVAQELAQDTMARLCRDWWRVRRMDHPRAWVYRVAINLAHSHFRRQSAQRRARDRVQSSRSEHHWDPDVASDIATRTALAGLPKRMRSALVLRYYLDLPFAEIATLMGISQSTAKSLVTKGVARLRAEGELTSRGREVPDGS